MVQVSYPGVYIQEKSSGVRTITGVATSITGFVDAFPRGVLDLLRRSGDPAEPPARHTLGRIGRQRMHGQVGLDGCDEGGGVGHAGATCNGIANGAASARAVP